MQQQIDSTLAYHLEELESALKATDLGRNRPILLPEDRTILDVGCGIGQSFVAWNTPGPIYVGLDIDEDAIRYGIEHYGSRFQYVWGRAESIPFPAATFDLAFSRVSLPYTDIPKALREMARVLKPGGRIWVTVHPRDRPGAMLSDVRGWRKKAYRIYEWLNGYCLKYFGFLVPLGGRCVSWQDIETMCRLLGRVGFSVSVDKKGAHTVLHGVKGHA